MKLSIDGKDHIRYFSPVSKPDDFGKIELVMKFETHGILSKHFKALNIGKYDNKF